MTSSPQYFLGFDGGATKTAGAIIDSNGNAIAERTSGGPSNFQIIGTEQASRNIMDVANAMLDETGVDFLHVAGIFLGLTGAGRKADQDIMLVGFSQFLKSAGRNVPWIGVESDALAALEGAFPGKAGMILISGTGSILLAKDDHGTVRRVGGWGRFVGDEGSGYFIGKAGLTACAKEYDGRGNATRISELVRERMNIDSPQTLVRKIYQENFDIASVARLVIDAATEGDEIARSIIDAASDELILHVRSAIRQIGKEIPIAFMGSIITHHNPLVTRLTGLILQEFPMVRICPPEQSAAVGAALLALKGATNPS